MNKPLHTSLFALLAVVACDAPEPADADAPTPGGKADAIDDNDTYKAEDDVYFVFTNGVFCFTDPCPSVTAVGPDGERHQLANAIFPEDALEGANAMLSGGVAVTGEIVDGDWSPGEAGTVLEVDEIVGFAQEHLVVSENLACFTAPCPTHAVYGADGSERPLSGVDVALDLFTSEDQHEVAGQILNSEVTAIGWVREGSWEPNESGNVLIVSRLVLGVQEYDLRNTGVVCFTAPCPSLEASDANGEITDLAGINADPTRLTFEEQGEALNPLAEGESVPVRGWITQGGWEPLGPGNLMYVLDFL